MENIKKEIKGFIGLFGFVILLLLVIIGIGSSLNFLINNNAKNKGCLTIDEQIEKLQIYKMFQNNKKEGEKTDDKIQ